jgi:hypothetical protein
LFDLICFCWALIFIHILLSAGDVFFTVKFPYLWFFISLAQLWASADNVAFCSQIWSTTCMLCEPNFSSLKKSIASQCLPCNNHSVSSWVGLCLWGC